MWTEFFDKCPGGKLQTSWAYIYVEKPEQEAIEVFKAALKLDPTDVHSSQCGEDYARYEHETLQEATAYRRGCEFNSHAGDWLETQCKTQMHKYQPLNEFLKRQDVLVLGKL